MNGIGIQLDGDTEFLDLPNDASIELSINNPLLGDASVLSPGAFSLPFNMPAGKDSPKNAQKLKHPEVVENNESYQLQKASLFLKGLKFKTGTLKSSSIDKTVSANFLFGLSQVDQRIKTARLRDVMDETIIIDNADIVKRIYFKKYVNADWNVTINGKNYVHSNINALVNHINDDHYTGVMGTGSFMPFAILHASGANSPGGITPPYVELLLQRAVTVNPDPNAELSIMVDNSNEGVTPPLWTNSVTYQTDGTGAGAMCTHPDTMGNIRQFITKVDDNINQEPPTDPNVTENSFWIIKTSDYVFEGFDMTGYYNGFRNFLADYLVGLFPSNKFRFPVCFNATPYSADGNVAKESEIVNGVAAGGLIINDWIHIKNYNSLQPFALLKYVFDKIATTFNFEWEGDFYNDPEFAGILLDNSNMLDLPMDYIGSQKYVFWKRSFNMNDLVPDVTVVDFLKAIASRFNLGVYPSEISGKVVLKCRENVAKATAYNDITEFSSPLSGIEDQRVTGFKMVVEKDETDLLSQTETFNIGDPQDSIEISCGRLFQTKISNDGLMQGPRVSRKNGDPKFKVRVFHFTGMVHNGSYSYQGATINASTFSESLDDFFLSPGIYNRFFKYWLLFQKNRRVITLNVKWPLRLLLRFDYEMKIRFNRNNYLLSSMKIKITNRGIQNVEAKLITMK